MGPAHRRGGHRVRGAADDRGRGRRRRHPRGRDTTTGDGGAAPQVDNTKWPAALNWVIPGTPEFTARYTAGDTAGGEPVIAGTGCTAAHGGDAYRYTVDFFTNLGAILDAQATATGHGVMTIGDEQLPTAPWPGLATDRGTAVLTLGSGEKVMATPGALIPMPSSGGALAGGAGVCADTLRAYGTPAAGRPVRVRLLQRTRPGVGRLPDDATGGPAGPAGRR